MSISSEITTLSNTIANIASAIEAQGIDVSDDDYQNPDYADYISQIENTNDYHEDQNIFEEVLNGTIDSLISDEIIYIRPWAFTGCIKLKWARFNNIMKIEHHAFDGCYQLSELLLPSDTLCILHGEDAFHDTLIGRQKGIIYVNDDLWEDYQEADNWSYFADYIRPISEYNNNTNS